MAKRELSADFADFFRSVGCEPDDHGQGLSADCKEEGYPQIAQISQIFLGLLSVNLPIMAKTSVRPTRGNNSH
jgi:hypothetical protein